MDSPGANETVAADAGIAQMSFFERLVGVYLEPTKTYADIGRKRSWVALFVLICIVALACSYSLQSRMDPADMAVKSVAMSKPIMKKIFSSDTIAQMEDQAAKQAMQPRTFRTKYGPIVATPILLYITYVVITTVFLLAFMAMGAGLSFKKCFTAVIWGFGPPALVVSLLSILFIFLKNPSDLDINPVNNVVSNLGPLVDFTAHPALNSLFSSIDIFPLWTAILLSMGFAAQSEGKLTAGKAAIPIVSLWVLWILIKMGFWAILG
jgi:hypothetical protein